MSTTADALSALDEVGGSTLAQRAVDRVTGWIAGRTSRRGFLVRAGLVGTALAVDPTGYVLRPGTAYASVCGPGTGSGSGWTVFCATINGGKNTCPPGSLAAGWWKADGASLCGGKARYIVDCNATCAKCSTPGARAGICSSGCWSCGCTGGPKGSCDQRLNCCNAFRYGQCNTQVRQVGGVQCRVVSCTPPWKWENCSTAPATDNRTRDHNSDYLPSAWSPITARHTALGEQGSPLGSSVWREFDVAGGRAQRYERGRISWSRATGARETVGPISMRFAVLGAEAGSLGFPTTPPLVLADGVGRASRFQRGRLSWSPSTGAWETRGAITTRYEQEGAETGSLGYPVAAEVVAGTGRSSRFERGTITTHPVLGTFVLRAPVAARYAELRGPAGLLGFPTADDRGLLDGGTSSRYQRGRISWHPRTGAWEVRGAADTLYAALGAEQGELGYPVGPDLAAPAGRANRFERGRISTSAATGAHWTRGPITERYEQLGAEAGALGYPVADEQVPSPGVRLSVFEHGRITHDEATGVTTVEPAETPSPAPTP
ncbi:MAG: hypothetical protein JWO60_2753 [Frankiales bacterium]|nr:hypothetical protein [Frankiales bacterium]